MTNEALGQLYERYGALVFRRCRALLSSEADANDALQETFMRVQRYPPSGVEVMGPWLSSVATRVCFDLLGQRRRSVPMAGRLVTKLKELMGATTSSTAETTLCLGSELSLLDEASREMALLYFLDGLTQDEVAERTGFSRKTVGVKLKAVEARLKLAFSAEGSVT